MRPVLQMLKIGRYNPIFTLPDAENKDIPHAADYPVWAFVLLKINA